MVASRKRRSTEIDQVVLRCLERHVAPGQSVAVGLSGGVDSVVLLDSLRSVAGIARVGLTALHVNHGLNPQADRWQDFCDRLCRSWAVPLTVRRVAVSVQGKGLEAAARQARYEAYASLGADWIALAHQRDDQAETVLHNLLRGAGVRGAAGMPEARPLPGSRARLLRPLLDVSREQIEARARAGGLAWVDDDSNLDARYTRNFLRHDILQRLRERFPRCDAALARAARHFEEAGGLLDDLAAADLSGAEQSDGLAVSALVRLGPARARNLLRHWLAASGVAMPDSARLAEVVRQATEAGDDREVRIAAAGGVWLRRYGGVLHLVPEVPAPPPALLWRGEAELTWSAGLVRFAAATGAGIAAAALEGKAVSLRPRGGGEALRLAAGAPRRGLKNLCQEHRIPPWQRRVMPLLWCGGNLVWVPGIGIDAAYRCAPGQAGWQVEWRSPEAPLAGGAADARG
jgi:tRNA(Ile)-lysidine synthase